MLLTTEQESILNGEQGKTRQKAIRLLIDLGKAAKAKKLVPEEKRTKNEGRMKDTTTHLSSLAG